jgi:hypothetical protein
MNLKITMFNIIFVVSFIIISMIMYQHKEHFENLSNENPSVDLYNGQSYHLLSDVMMPARSTESISCVNSRSCYASGFDNLISKTGNFRQLTNNYKRGYPDSCSSPYQELVLNFYKADPL